MYNFSNSGKPMILKCYLNQNTLKVPSIGKDRLKQTIQPDQGLQHLPVLLHRLDTLPEFSLGF